MAEQTLTEDQRETLLTWLAAEYDTRLLIQWFKERGWPELTKQLVYYYRSTYLIRVDELKKERRESALHRGLALKEERVVRLCDHADALEAIKWEPDDKGRLWNEKSWRETLDDIAKETGGRTAKVEVSGDPEKPVLVKTLKGVSMADL